MTRMPSIFREKYPMKFYVRYLSRRRSERYSISMLFQLIGLVFIVIIVMSSDVYGKLVLMKLLSTLFTQLMTNKSNRKIFDILSSVCSPQTTSNNNSNDDDDDNDNTIPVRKQQSGIVLLFTMLHEKLMGHLIERGHYSGICHGLWTDVTLVRHGPAFSHC